MGEATLYSPSPVRSAMSSLSKSSSVDQTVLSGRTVRPAISPGVPEPSV